MFCHKQYTDTVDNQLVSSYWHPVLYCAFARAVCNGIYCSFWRRACVPQSTPDEREELRDAFRQAWMYQLDAGEDRTRERRCAQAAYSLSICAQDYIWRFMSDRMYFPNHTHHNLSLGEIISDILKAYVKFVETRRRSTAKSEQLWTFLLKSTHELRILAKDSKTFAHNVVLVNAIGAAYQPALLQQPVVHQLNVVPLLPQLQSAMSASPVQEHGPGPPSVGIGQPSVGQSDKVVVGLGDDEDADVVIDSEWRR